MKKVKKQKKIPKSSSTDYVKEAYRLYRKNRKKVYRSIFNNQGGHFIAIEDSMDSLSINQSYLKIADGDWSKAAEYKILEGAILQLGWDYKKAGLLYILPQLHQKIMPRYYKYFYHEEVKRKGSIKFKKTDVMREYILRGWVHIDDVSWNPARPYTIRANVGDLVWPHSFRHHQDAIGERDKVAIAGFGECPIPKDYNYANRDFNSRGLHTMGFSTQS
jgi:hypothetical protein